MGVVFSVMEVVSLVHSSDTSSAFGLVVFTLAVVRYTPLFTFSVVKVL